MPSSPATRFSTFFTASAPRTRRLRASFYFIFLFHPRSFPPGPGLSISYFLFSSHFPCVVSVVHVNPGRPPVRTDVHLET